MVSELELDKFFWDAISTDTNLQRAFLQHTKFKDCTLKLLIGERWHQRWYRDPETKRESETDITLTFEDLPNGHLYSIHVENKPPHRVWEKLQAESYRPRAQNRMQKWKHQDSSVGLIATKSYLDAHHREVNFFDFTMTYEEIGEYVPAFAAVCATENSVSLQ